MPYAKFNVVSHLHYAKGCGHAKLNLMVIFMARCLKPMSFFWFFFGGGGGLGSLWR